MNKLNEKNVIIKEKVLVVDCPNCGKHLEGKLPIYNDDMGLHTICPECGSSFDIEIN